MRPDADGRPADWQRQAAVDRLQNLNGVRVAGRRVTLPELPIRRGVSFSQPSTSAMVIGADPAALEVMAPSVVSGRLFDAYHEEGSAQVILLSRHVADRLSITRPLASVYVEDRAYSVIGIFDDVARRPEALQAVILPFGTANEVSNRLASDAERDIVIETEPGAAQLIGRQAPVALHPESPASLRAQAPPDPRTLRMELEVSVVRASFRCGMGGYRSSICR